MKNYIQRRKPERMREIDPENLMTIPQIVIMDPDYCFRVLIEEHELGFIYSMTEEDWKEVESEFFEDMTESIKEIIFQKFGNGEMDYVDERTTRLNPENLVIIPQIVYEDPDHCFGSDIEENELDFIRSMTEEDWLKVESEYFDIMIESLKETILSRFSDRIKKFVESVEKGEI